MMSIFSPETLSQLFFLTSGDISPTLRNKTFSLLRRYALNKGTNFLTPLGLGSTGRTVAKNLTERLAMKEIMSNPSSGKVLIQTMNDTSGRWNGWSKMANNASIHGVEIHYNALWKNGVIKAVDDFKFISK